MLDGERGVSSRGSRDEAVTASFNLLDGAHRSLRVRNQIQEVLSEGAHDSIYRVDGVDVAMLCSKEQIAPAAVNETGRETKLVHTYVHLRFAIHAHDDPLPGGARVHSVDGDLGAPRGTI